MRDLLKRTLYNLIWWYMTLNYYFIHCNGFYYIVLVFRIFTTPVFFVHSDSHKKDPNHKARNDGSFEKAFIIFSEHKDLPFGIINTYFLPKLRLHLFIDIVLQ